MRTIRLFLGYRVMGVAVAFVAVGFVLGCGTSSSSVSPSPSSEPTGASSPAATTGVISATPLTSVARSTEGFAQVNLDGSSSVRTISVGGAAQVSFPPDTAVISLQIQSMEDSVSQALTAATAAKDGLLSALDDITEVTDKSSSLSIYPRNMWNPETNIYELVGYTANYSIQITVGSDDVDRLGTLSGNVIDTAVGSAGDLLSVNGISFSVADIRPFREQAQRAAADDARAIAEVYTDQLGVGLGAVVSISAFASTPVSVYADESLAFSAAPVAAFRDVSSSVEPGSVSFSTSVQIEFKIIN